jgi:hypothetical protein
MGISYENTRVHFDKILKIYKDYLDLYKEFNDGSLQGATPFDEFYWRMTYFSKYQDRRNFGHTGY